MNYSTLKKTVALSFASLMVVGMANAQTDSTKTATTSSETTTPKVFGGLGQYKTFSIGANVGVTSPFIPFGTDAVSHMKPQLGYGVSLRQQVSHPFGIQLDLHGGKVAGDASKGLRGFHGTSFETTFYSATLSGIWQFGSISFLHRTNGINFYGSAGAGLAFYNPTFSRDGSGSNSLSYLNSDGSKHYVKELIVPIGVGAKVKLTDALALNIGYTANFIDGYNFSGFKTIRGGQAYKDHFAYAYGGLEYTFGSKSKPNIDWVNPIAIMYDELYDAALRQEVEALKGRVTNVETAVNDLKKDSDGDGVADQFDKCPGTAAGSVVDGSGCVIVFPKDTVAAAAPVGTAYSNIQFEFDSSVLRTSSYPVLDATSADLRASGKGVEVDGFASSEGTAAHNLQLSKDRANSVKTYLVNSGVDAKKVKVKGFGETNPIADNSTEEGRVLNRRVQFKQK